MKIVFSIVLILINFNVAFADSCNCSASSGDPVSQTLGSAIDHEIASSCERDPWQKHCNTKTVTPHDRTPASQNPCPPQRSTDAY